MPANIFFTIKSWDEKTWDGRRTQDVTGAKETHSTVHYSYTGELVGESELHYLMTYRADGTASFVGQERITGTLGGHTGSFVIQHTGVYEDEIVKGSFFVVAGSGTDGLATLRGTGSMTLVGESATYPMQFDYQLG
jgi:hypothetical protein